MLQCNEKIIKNKVGLLNLAEELGKSFCSINQPTPVFNTNTDDIVLEPKID